MGVTGRIQFVYGLVAWLLGTVLVLAAFGAYSVELAFIFSLVGFFLIHDLTASSNVTPPWRKRLWIVMVLGLLGLGGIVLYRTLETLPEVL